VPMVHMDWVVHLRMVYVDRVHQGIDQRAMLTEAKWWVPVINWAHWSVAQALVESLLG
jgi:hypothetical protein